MKQPTTMENRSEGPVPQEMGSSAAAPGASMHGPVLHDWGMPGTARAKQANGALEKGALEKQEPCGTFG